MQQYWRFIMWVRPATQGAAAHMLTEHEPLSVNIIGHLAGTIVFAIFLALALRGSPVRRTRQTLLPVASAVLALLWNAGSFATLLLSSGTVRWWVEALSFCTLSLLPAVLLHLSLHSRLRPVAVTGYMLSAVATAMHLSEGLAPALDLHKWALWVITYGFGALTLVYAGIVLRQGGETHGRASQILTAMGLLLFAVTFSHFGAGHPPQPWRELLVHHAGIPIALLILLQDYRFVFLDAFVRFLANVILAVALSYGGIRLAERLGPAVEPSQPLAGITAVAGLCALLILFAFLRGVVQRFLTRAVFRSGGVESAVLALRSTTAQSRTEHEYLRFAAEQLAAAARTPRFEILGGHTGGEGASMRDLDYPAVTDEEPWLARETHWSWAEVIVPIRLSQGDIRYLLLGRRRGGRRYFSEDLRSLNYLAAVAAEEIGRLRAAEMQRLVSEAELRALHSQINPHFLFNVLNTLFGLIPREALGARRTVLNLAEIFRYVLKSDKILIPLSEEIKIVKAYLEIERLRLGSRLQTVIQVDDDAAAVLIPVLSIQPLVENAIKHAISKRIDDGWLKVSATLTDGVANIVVEDSGPGSAPGITAGQPGERVGLANVSRRLQLCFGPDAGIRMHQDASGTCVEFSVPAGANHAVVPRSASMSGMES